MKIRRQDVNFGNGMQIVKSMKPSYVSRFASFTKKATAKYNKGLFGLVVGLFTLGLEKILNNDVFHCPQRGFRMYGVAFFTVPTILLLFLNLLTMPMSGNIRIWTLCESYYVKAYRRYGDVLSGCFSTCVLGLIAPTAWVFLSFLNGRDLVCWELGYNYDDNVTLDYVRKRGFHNMNVTEYKNQVQHAKAKSQTLGVMILGCALLFMAMFVIARRSCLKPFNAKERLPGLWELERDEAMAASNELRRLLGQDGDEPRRYLDEDQVASLVKRLFILEQIATLKSEREGLRQQEDDKKKDEKLREIETEIEEFEKLEWMEKTWDMHKYGMV